jgi:hypothetical protein
MRSMAMTLLIVIATSGATLAQPAPQKLPVALEVRSEGQATSDATAARLRDEVQRGLAALGDVDLTSTRPRRVIWIVAGTTAGVYAASVMVTERYDRETLMVLGIEDDDMAERMMSLQIANDHQIFTGTDLADVGRRIVTAINTGIFARMRTVRPKE